MADHQNPCVRSRIRRRLAAVAAVAVATGSATVGLGLGSAQASSSVQQQSAAYAGGYLARNIGSDGSVPGAASDTLRAAIGLAVTGHGATAFNRALSYIEAHTSDFTETSSSAVRPGSTGLVAVAAVAAGQDPTAFGASSANLVAQIESTQVTSGANAGEYSDPAGTGYPGVLNHSLALLGLAAAHVPKTDSSVASALAWLVAQQCDDGGFQNTERGSGPNETACNASDEDSDTSGYAVQALGAYGQSSTYAKATAYFHAGQDGDGGFGFAGTSNSDSTGIVSAALASMGVDPDGPAFAKGAATPASWLRSVQHARTATSTNDGAYSYDGNPADDYDLVYGTEEAVVGELGATLPMSRVVLTDDEPRASVPTTAAPSGPATPINPSPPSQSSSSTPASSVPRSSAPSCVAVIDSRGRPEVVPSGCVKRAPGATPCTLYFAPKTFRKTARPAGCLPLAASHTPCNVSYDRHHRKTVLPAKCEPLFRR